MPWVTTSFFPTMLLIRVYRAQNIRNRIRPKRPTLHLHLAKNICGQNVHGQNLLAKMSWPKHPWPKPPTFDSDSSQTKWIWWIHNNAKTMFGVTHLIKPPVCKRMTQSILSNFYQQILLSHGPTIQFVILTLYSIDYHFDAPTTDSFWKHCRKRRNCSLRAISAFPTLFFAESDNYIPICPMFLTLYLYLLLNRKSIKLAYEVEG